MEKPVLKIHRMYDDVILPKYQTAQSACFDIHAYLNQENIPLKTDNIARCYDHNGFDKIGSVKIWENTKIVTNRPIHSTSNVPYLNLSPQDRALIPTGLILDIPEGYSVRTHIRSSVALKQGLMLANGEGVIDSDYIDELFILIINNANHIVSIEHGDRLCQGELVANMEHYMIESILRPTQKTNRTGGLGSTGK